MSCVENNRNNLLLLRKYIPIHGVRVSDEINFSMPIDGSRYVRKYINSIRLISYDEYLKECSNIINKEDIKQCDSVAVFETQSNNSMEVENLKILISALYFSYRIYNTSRLKDNFIFNEMKFYGDLSSGEINRDVLLKKIEERYINKENEYFLNYNIQGYHNNQDDINSLYWYVSLGNNIITKDNFDRFLTRGFSVELDDEYKRQSQFHNYENIVNLDVNQGFIDKIKIIEKRLNQTDEYSKKIKSTLRLYYNLLYENDIEQSILICASILETLLLKTNDTKR